MTSVLATRDSVRDATTAAAAAAAHALAPAEIADAPTDATPADLLPPGVARAVSLNVRGAASGSLVLVLSEELAGAICDGPLGPQDLVAALGPALADAGSALEAFCGAPLHVEAAHEVEAAIALAGTEAGTSAAVPLRSGGVHVATVALLLDPAGAEIPQPRAATAPPAHDFASFGDAAAAAAAPAARSLDLLHGVEMGVTAELGRTRMTVRDLLSLTPGAVVELDRAAGSPVDVLVNGTLIARGEVVVIDEEFGIRISEIVGAPSATGLRR